MIILDVPQGSEAWLQARCGLPTASHFNKIICMDGTPSKQRFDYANRLVGERITGKPEECFQSAAMARGKELEDEARKFYEVTTGETVRQVGLCITDGPYKYGCSPDALVGEKGGSELKVPLVSTHVSYLLDDKLPSQYFTQVQGNLLVTGREWWDFVSYSPGLKPLMVRVYPDKEFQISLRRELEVFCELIDKLVEKIK